MIFDLGNAEPLRRYTGVFVPRRTLSILKRMVGLSAGSSTWSSGSQLLYLTDLVSRERTSHEADHQPKIKCGCEGWLPVVTGYRSGKTLDLGRLYPISQGDQ